MAIELCHGEKPTKEVAEELGIPAKLIRRWKRAQCNFLFNKQS